MLLQLLIGLGAHRSGKRRRSSGTSAGTCGATRPTCSPKAARGSTPRCWSPLSVDSEPRVRLEAARCLVLAGQAAGVRTLRGLLHEADHGAADAAIAAGGHAGRQGAAPRPGRADQESLRPRRGRASAFAWWARSGSSAATRPPPRCASCWRGRISLFPGETKRFRNEVHRMLKRIAAKQPAGGTPERPYPPGQRDERLDVQRPDLEPGRGHFTGPALLGRPRVGRGRRGPRPARCSANAPAASAPSWSSRTIWCSTTPSFAKRECTARSSCACCARRGFRAWDFLPGVSADEIRRLFADVAAAKAPPGRYAHIRLGRIEMGASAPVVEAGLADAAFHAEQLARVQSVYGQISPPSANSRSAASRRS